MATQGVVSIAKSGQTIIKAICGCNGYQAQELVNAVKGKHCDTLTLRSVYDAAREVAFGCRNCLVVMDQEEIIFNGELPDLYRKTFDDPEFNPRWENGTADCVEVVEIERNKEV